MTVRQRLGWGGGVILAFGVFGAALAVMVATAVSGRVDLVADDYYREGIRHQEHIDALERGGESAPAVSVAAGWIEVRFPARVNPRDLQVEIALYRPSDRRMDRTVRLELDAGGTQRLPARHLARGLWRVKISWRERGGDCLSETPILLE